jgi:cysteine-rich repeat protein
MNSCPGDGCVGVCGNGVLEGMEACDDGNTLDTDNCVKGCQVASCGDGFVEDGVENCDDGNNTDTDACVMCKAARCGDGLVQDGVEACDDANPVDTDACLTTCKAATCGDGFTQAGVEDCDDANAVDTDTCDMACKTVVHRKVFVTSLLSTGILGGLSGADSRCETLAEIAGLQVSFKAWLSDATTGPADRFDTSFTGVYELVDGTLVAHGWTDLTDGSLSHPINLTEKGDESDASVWTNATPAGEPPGASHCDSWTSKSSMKNGSYGFSSASDTTWTQALLPAPVLSCNITAAVYCFEEP